ncbi:MAG: PAS domain-containing sensor histidine kinase [Planctomycetota bacterium]
MSRSQNPVDAAAPATGDSPAALRELARALQQHPHYQVLMDAVPGPAMVLDAARRIVLANRRLLDLTGAPTVIDVVGKRPGEAFGCRYALEGSDGCGQSWGCWHCTASRLLAAVERGAACPHSGRGRLGVLVDGSLQTAEFEFVFTRDRLADHELIVVTMRDLAGEARSSQLERVFFHDIMNVAARVAGLGEVVAETLTGDTQTREHLDLLQWSSHQLVEELRFHRSLAQAERGELELDPGPVDTRDLLQRVVALYQRPDLAASCSVHAVPGRSYIVETDAVLLSRILGNLIKNAVEATPAGGRVEVTATCKRRTVLFAVHSPLAMPTPVQAGVFTRSFSTKGESGRGLGTYSTKLLGEEYLGGSVWFETDADRGTTFFVGLPLDDTVRRASARRARQRRR